MINGFLFKAANQLQNQYTNTAQDLNSRYNLTTQAQSRAEALKKRADKLATDTTAKLKKLTGKCNALIVFCSVQTGYKWISKIGMN